VVRLRPVRLLTYLIGIYSPLFQGYEEQRSQPIMHI
jgi:hypothetical protein